MEKWKIELRELKLASIQEKAPGFYDLSGGERMKLKGWKDTTANGLTACIVDWVTFHGYSATRISTMGTVRKINGEMKWTHGSTRRGTADIHAVIKGRHVSIEVKAGKDVMSEDQKRERERIEKAGGIYYIATDMASFVEWYNKTFENV